MQFDQARGCWLEASGQNYYGFDGVAWLEDDSKPYDNVEQGSSIKVHERSVGRGVVCEETQLVVYMEGNCLELTTTKETVKVGCGKSLGGVLLEGRLAVGYIIVGLRNQPYP